MFGAYNTSLTWHLRNLKANVIGFWRNQDEVQCNLHSSGEKFIY